MIATLVFIALLALWGHMLIKCAIEAFRKGDE